MVWVHPAVGGMLVCGVTPAASIKATGGEPSPWEGMTSEVSPWEGMTADIAESEWIEVRRRRATGRGRPAKGESSRTRRPRARDTDSNVIVRSGDRDSSTAAIQISPVVPNWPITLYRSLGRQKRGSFRQRTPMRGSVHVCARLRRVICGSGSGRRTSTVSPTSSSSSRAGMFGSARMATALTTLTASFV